MAPGALRLRVLARFKRRDGKYVPAPRERHGNPTRHPPPRAGPSLPTPADFRSRALSRFHQKTTELGDAWGLGKLPELAGQVELLEAGHVLLARVWSPLG